MIYLKRILSANVLLLRKVCVFTSHKLYSKINFLCIKSYIYNDMYRVVICIIWVYLSGPTVQSYYFYKNVNLNTKLV